MRELPHIYRQKKLTNISQRRYKRKYNPEYLEKKASQGASIKLGFGDFDRDGDLDGLYPKQRAGVAEKPGLHVDPPRGPFSTTRLAFAEPFFGPTLMEAATVAPQAGPVSLGSSIVIPVAGPIELEPGVVAPVAGPQSVTSVTVIPEAGPSDISSITVVPEVGPSSINSTTIIPEVGPSNINSTTLTPQVGPSSVNSVVAVPQSGPSNVNTAAVVPEAGPSSLNSSVVAPQLGPSSVETADLAPDVGPINLSSTVVVPASGPSQLNGIATPAAGPLNLTSGVAVPTTGITGLTSDTVKPGLGVSDLGAEIQSFFASESSISVSTAYNISLSTDGNTIAFVHDAKGYVYERSDSSSAWSQKGAVLENRGKGWSTSTVGTTDKLHMSGDGSVVAIAAPWFDGGATYYQEIKNNGCVEIFRWNASKSRWDQDTIQDENDNNAVEDIFIMGDDEYQHMGTGIWLSRDGTYIAAGAQPQNANAQNPGYFKVFKYNGSKWVHRNSVHGTSDNLLETESISITEDGSRVLHTGNNFQTNSVWEWDESNSEYTHVENILNAFGYEAGSSLRTYEDSNEISIDGNIVASCVNSLSEDYGQRTVIEKWNEGLGQYRPHGDFDFGAGLGMSDDGSLMIVMNPTYGSSNVNSDGSLKGLDGSGYSQNDAGGQAVIYRDKGFGVDPWEVVTEITGVRRTGSEPTKNDVGKSIAISGDGTTVAVARDRAGRIDVFQMPEE